MSQWIFLDVIPIRTSSMVIYNDIKNGQISLQKEGKIQEELQFIRRSNKCNKNYEKLYNDQKKLLEFIMIILEWYSRLNTNQLMKKDSKY